ncbi:MAG: hypothetical protein JW940_04515, partial [Polyangiaceae bacterium]|nr:hypothetical protein [Polyangiaceae bacterium]
MHFLYLPDIRAIIRRNYERTGRTGLQTFWRYQAVRGGRVLEESPRFMPNIFHDDGEELVCKIVFDETVTVPASYYIGLDNRASLAEADALSGMTSAEEDGTGYARQAVASNNTDFTVSQDG